MSTQTPRYAHDCTECVFVAQAGEYDCWICPADQMTAVRRKSDEPSDYGCFPIFVAKNVAEYAAVYKLAVYHAYDRFTEDQLRRMLSVLIGEDLWDLQSYINWLNRPEDGVIKGQLMDEEDWAEQGITKASQLGEYLDGCVAREKQKDMMA